MGPRKINKSRILIVDDDVRTTQMFARMLRDDGHDVEVVHDGAEAMDLLSRGTIYDILLADVQMPNTDGFAVAQFARSRCPSLPIIFVTGYPERVLKRMKSFDPAPKMFVKPFEYAALAAEVMSLTLSTKTGQNTK